MNARPIPLTFAAYCGARAAVLLALVIACVPALASSSLTLCDKEARKAQSLDVPAMEFSIRSVDLGSVNSVTAGSQPLDKPIESREWALPSLTLTPVEIDALSMNSRRFDWSNSRLSLLPKLWA